MNDFEQLRDAVNRYGSGFDERALDRVEAEVKRLTDERDSLVADIRDSWSPQVEQLRAYTEQLTEQKMEKDLEIERLRAKLDDTYENLVELTDLWTGWAAYAASRPLPEKWETAGKILDGIIDALAEEKE
jgi:uncharacterized coiled-coil DUF342 family protein